MGKYDNQTAAMNEFLNKLTSDKFKGSNDSPPSRQSVKLDVKMDLNSVFQGIVFSEILGKPKSKRMRRRGR